MISSARTDDILKVIVGNPTIIKAFKEGVPGNGKPFPDGSRIAKLQWKHKKSAEAPFVVDVPAVFSQNFVMEKDSKRFPASGGWGYAVFNYDPKTDAFTPDAAQPLRLRTCVPYGHQGEGLRLPPISEALNALRNTSNFMVVICTAAPFIRRRQARPGGAATAAGQSSEDPEFQRHSHAPARSRAILCAQAKPTPKPHT